GTPRDLLVGDGQSGASRRLRERPDLVDDDARDARVGRAGQDEPEHARQTYDAQPLHGWRLVIGLPRGLPGDHAPLLTALRVHGEVAHGEVLLLARVLHVHLGHAVDHPDASVHAGAALTRRDAPVVRLAPPEIRGGVRLRPAPRR